MSFSRRFLPLVGVLTLLPIQFAYGQSPSFKDVSTKNPAYQAVEYLKGQGILGGYSDGTFKPDQKVSRSEATKIITASALGADTISSYKTTVFADVPATAWFLPYVEAARVELKIIDGPPKTPNFFPSRSVKLAEFLKLLLLATKTDPNAYGEVQLPLSRDVTDASAWYYPYMRYAISSSVLQINADDTLLPDREVTRADVANMMFRLAMYKAGRRTQALLSEVENELVNVMQFLADKNLPQAENASARALLAAKGGYASRPNSPVAQGALKTAEAFRSIVRGYKAGVNGQLDETIRLAKEAWSLADQAKEKSSDLAPLSEKIQQIAATMSTQARETLSQPTK
ncbi:S-layer homology domain-containing protein [Candidatus Woesebacteria bacterium]|nr:S-layer homology domain-containing protein [Candidatus Woesebacteria bacterium]